MTDQTGPATRAYHERTKLFPGASTAPRRVDAALVPKQYKRYVDLPSLELPAPSIAGRSLFEVLAHPAGNARPLSLAGLAALLHYAGGIVRRRNLDGRELAFRAASCTGALYHVEFYLVCGEVDGALPDGVYHYDVPSGSLREMRRGDYRGALAAACCDEGIATAAASVVLTSTFWRNAWRYEERAYRHVFWDAGTLLANLLAVAESHSLGPVLYSAFVDGDVNALLGLDARREAEVAVVSLGVGEPAQHVRAAAPLTLATEPLSRAEIEYPLIWQTHAATSLRDCDEVRAWRSRAAAESPELSTSVPAEVLTLEESIERRVSARRFSETPLPREALRTVLGAAKGSLRSDHALAHMLCRPMLIVNRVEGLDDGAYGVDAQDRLMLLSRGNYAAAAAHLALDQPAAGSAAVNLYFIAGLDEVTSAVGERGYRAVQLEAGIRTGQVYLASTALGLKATGLTFYDDEVSRFFDLDPLDALMLMLVAFGA